MDVDFSEGCIYVRQTLQHASTGIIFEEPKTKSSKRKISIPDQTLGVLKEYRKEVGMFTELCFTATNGSPIQPKNYHRWWTTLQQRANKEWNELEEQKKILKKSTLAEDAKKLKKIVEYQKALEKSLHKNFHALRHTHATMLLANLSDNESIIDVSSRLGHSKASVTLDIYGHVIPGNDKKMATKIQSLYGF